jgi:hypothetical protein
VLRAACCLLLAACRLPLAACCLLRAARCVTLRLRDLACVYVCARVNETRAHAQVNHDGALCGCDMVHPTYQADVVL